MTRAKPFSSTDRMVKHLNELAGSLKDHEKAVFLQVFQYRITEKKERLRSTHYNVATDICHGEYCGNTIRFSA